jgi:hypothetical protein
MMRSKRQLAATGAAAWLMLSLALVPARAGAVCAGDCGSSGTVTIDKLIVMVNIALGRTALSSCEPGDVDGSGQITVDEIIMAVNNALNGCVDPTPTPSTAFLFTQPSEGQLSLAGPIDVALVLPSAADPQSLSVRLDGVPVTTALNIGNGAANGTLANVGEGQHYLVAVVTQGTEVSRTEVFFETEALQNPDDCEVLNNAECMLPYPSSRFLEPADTPTGWRIKFPASGMPTQNGRPLPAAPYQVLDGFSPTVQILMHFPGGVDPVLSNASRLLAETRTYDLRSLDADSPTVLLDADTGERIIHFIEPDARAADPARQVLFMRPGKSLTPSHRYIVAMRNLIHPDGSMVEPEPVFAVLRDNRPTTIDAVAQRRALFDDIFARLAAAGIDRSDLVLAFDFSVQSDQTLTGQMLSMRDQSFAWLAQQSAPTFTIDRVVENDCSMSGVSVWRQIEGSYQVPLFLTSDPVTASSVPGTLKVDSNGVPVQNGFTNPPLTIAIPCTALANGGTAKHPLILGHGLFGDGRSFVEELANEPTLSGFDYVAGATDWRGLSAPDIAGNLVTSFVGRVILDLSNFAALPDRLRQGQLNTLMLGKMMKIGVFNADPAFQTPSGAGVLTGPQSEEFYFGASLGGIMGLMYTALSPDIINGHVDVPAINFSLLLQRATPFIEFEGALQLTGITDPMDTALVLGIVHELWVRGEPAGYATHITSNPLPGTNAKNILMTGAWLDQEVSNQGTEIAARTLGLPSLIGSLLPNRPLIPDRPGPLPSALVFYDTASFDPNNPADQPFIPPLANLPPQPNQCDPHGRQAFIPAAIKQMLEFLQPGGHIENFCNGLCDAGDPSEIPYGDDQPCDPLS